MAADPQNAMETIGDAKIAGLCRQYRALDADGRTAFRATIDAGMATKFHSFSRRLLASARSDADLEMALLAAGLAYEGCADERDICVAVDDLRRRFEVEGHPSHLFVERVALLLSPRISNILRRRLRRRVSQIRFADDTNSEIPQHNVLEAMLQNPRLLYLLRRGVEVALQLRIDRRQLRDLVRAMWLEHFADCPSVLQTSDDRLTFAIKCDRYRGEVVVRLECQTADGILKNRSSQKHFHKAKERFRVVVEAFASAFTPLAFPNTDRLSFFKRSTSEIFTWHGDRPTLK